MYAELFKMVKGFPVRIPRIVSIRAPVSFPTVSLVLGNFVLTVAGNRERPGPEALDCRGTDMWPTWRWYGFLVWWYIVIFLA